LEEDLNLIPGAAELSTWFGCWPSFHDAEITSLSLGREGVSTLQLHTWRRTEKVDDRGYYVQEKQVLVNLRMEEILALNLLDFNHQNVIFGLSISPIEGGFEIVLDPCYGLSGNIAARKLSVDFEPISTEAR
jgi:hypothetical protein